MKKVIFFSIAALLLVIFTGCGNNDAENGGANENDTVMDQNGNDDAYNDAPDAYQDDMQDDNTDDSMR